jgi:leucyl-tRNA synthetase
MENIAAATAAPAPAACHIEFRQGAKALRLEIHTVLKQVDYDYQRMQYNTVVSGAMKMLNALEDFKADGSRRRRWPGRRLWHPAARAVPGHAAHRPRAVAALGYAAVLGDCSTRPGRG